MFYELLVISLYIVLWGTVSGAQEGKSECMSYLCMGYGILGRTLLYHGKIPEGMLLPLRKAISQFEDEFEQ